MQDFFLLTIIINSLESYKFFTTQHILQIIILKKFNSDFYYINFIHNYLHTNFYNDYVRL